MTSEMDSVFRRRLLSALRGPTTQMSRVRLASEDPSLDYARRVMVGAQLRDATLTLPELLAIGREAALLHSRREPVPMTDIRLDGLVLEGHRGPLKLFTC